VGDSLAIAPHLAPARDSSQKRVWYDGLMCEKRRGFNRQRPLTRASHIVFDQVTFMRGERAALRDISLILREGRVGLVGDNGAGKSSLLRLVHGLSLPTSGTVTTVGLETVTRRKELPFRVGFLFQNPDRQIIFPTVGEEIAFGFEERGASRRDAGREVQVWLERFGCADWGDRVVHDLSEGQKQLVCLISVLAVEPDCRAVAASSATARHGEPRP
jgi:biotin transport system ATP-binding protein